MSGLPIPRMSYMSRKYRGRVAYVRAVEQGHVLYDLIEEKETVRHLYAPLARFQERYA